MEPGVNQRLTLGFRPGYLEPQLKPGLMFTFIFIFSFIFKLFMFHILVLNGSSSSFYGVSLPWSCDLFLFFKILIFLKTTYDVMTSYEHH